MSNYNPSTATPQEKLDYRRNLLIEFLDDIPFTTTQRSMIDHHVGALEGFAIDVGIEKAKTNENR